MASPRKRTKPGDWLPHFQQNQSTQSGNEPDWENLPDCSLSSQSRRLLSESIAIFQLGETGGGTRLRRFVREQRERQTPGLDHRYEKAVELFIGEEHEHARLLANLVSYLGGRLKKKHWANHLFRSVRTLLGLRFNLQVLLTAELIAEAYYGLLYQCVPDPAVKQVCGRIVKEEIGHIGFHQTFFSHQQRWQLPGATALWSAQFQILYLLAEHVVWKEHGRCFLAFSVDRNEFRRRARSVCRRFLRQATDSAGTDPAYSGPTQRLVLCERPD